MSPRTHRGWYVTGTDTGIGKTHASVALLHRLRADGVRAVGMKPVASGCARSVDGWRNDDALALQAASDPCPDYALVNPYALPRATAPQLAAEAAGVHIALPPLRAAWHALQAQSDAGVMEGVGGWLAPLADDLEQADLARALDLPVLLVVGVRLGCLSHARLSARAIAEDGLRLAGWVANRIDPEFEDGPAYLDLLRKAIPAPCLGVLPWQADPAPDVLAAALHLPDAVGAA